MIGRLSPTDYPAAPTDHSFLAADRRRERSAGAGAMVYRENQQRREWKQSGRRPKHNNNISGGANCNRIRATEMKFSNLLGNVERKINDQSETHTQCVCNCCDKSKSFQESEYRSRFADAELIQEFSRELGENCRQPLVSGCGWQLQRGRQWLLVHLSAGSSSTPKTTTTIDGSQFRLLCFFTPRQLRADNSLIVNVAAVIKMALSIKPEGSLNRHCQTQQPILADVD